ncbi:DUF262 domain-containing protein [Bradyrhizobium erythrophlei]|uniref:GmrSD restriction endonucleases N-terminal domain-containing protein n=1 Tax=Bradyrhizobium erythrophlei TaxID=1437360 RepID=A0A1M5PZ61_9BRAD|nr:DUF262 domain-containing protein [Bradyrhizobium erythrophlei]SHH07068.1 Protein of unknown function DUF262 [Bradyrhizobium erythrophlei]
MTTIALVSEVEGFDDAPSASWGEYSLDSVFVRNEIRSISDVIRRIDSKRYILDPDFQRDFVWPEDKQSKLIESCIMRIPLPVFYLAEAKDGRIIVVDGLQRLTTFHRYVKGLFRLKDLAPQQSADVSHLLDGKKFSELAIELQERLLDTQLITYILDSKAPERARLDIFERVNSGVPLTRQQMRNALYNGPATLWLKHAADSTMFKLATGESLDRKAMRDREAINRFCSFFLNGWKSYKSDMEVFLASGLEAMNVLPQSELLGLRNKFSESMRMNRYLFGDHAFRKSLGNPDGRRNVLNIALFDVCSVLIARYSDELATKSKSGDRVRLAFKYLLSDDRFLKAITYGTNSTQAVTTRFELAEAVLNECFDY